MASAQLAAILLVVTAWFAEAGHPLPAAIAKSTKAFAASPFPVNTEGAKMLLEDGWVDTLTPEAFPSMCKSLTECGWNRSVVAYADLLGSKRLLFSEEIAEAAPAPVQVPATGSDRKADLEVHAVRLSLLLEQTCMESGPRACWRSAAQRNNVKGGAKELRPVTITFGEPRSPAAAYSDRSDRQTSLVASLREFRLASW